MNRKIWQNANGTFSHHMNKKVEWSDLDSCTTDLKLSMEWCK